MGLIPKTTAPHVTTASKKPRAPAMGIRARRAHALDQVLAARNALTAAMRDLLNARSVRCAPGCKGWFVSTVDHDPGREVSRCDDCATANGYADAVGDHDMLQLPEACKALQRAFREDARAREIADEQVARDLGWRLGELRIRAVAEGAHALVADIDHGLSFDVTPDSRSALMRAAMHPWMSRIAARV